MPSDTRQDAPDFGEVKARLEEIAKAVEDDSVPLDEALDLYEEAVKLGLQASSLLEVGIPAEDEAEAGEADASPATGANNEKPLR